jgi:hypothetical protein
MTPRRSFDLAGTTKPSADAAPPAAAVDSPTPTPPPAAPAAGSTAPPASPPPSRAAGRTTHQATYTTGSLVAGLPDPRHDLVSVGVSLPRELVQAIDVLYRTTRRSKQNIITDALYAHLPETLVNEVRTALYPGAG